MPADSSCVPDRARAQTYMRVEAEAAGFTTETKGAVYTSTNPRSWGFDQNVEASILTAFDAVNQLPLAQRAE